MPEVGRREFIRRVGAFSSAMVAIGACPELSLDEGAAEHSLASDGDVELTGELELTHQGVTELVETTFAQLGIGSAEEIAADLNMYDVMRRWLR